MQYILSLSYGKDSLACLGAIEQLNWPLDRIVHSEVWATDTRPADLPPMVEFKARADAIIKARWGIPVERVRAERTAEQMFYHVRTRGNRAGERMGWPMIKGCELQKTLKVRPINTAQRISITYIGIAADEPERQKNWGTRAKALLWQRVGQKLCAENGVRKTTCFPRFIQAAQGAAVGSATTSRFGSSVYCAKVTLNIGH